MIIYITYRIKYDKDGFIHKYRFIEDVYVNKIPPQRKNIYRHRFYIDDNNEFFYISDYPSICATDKEPDSGHFVKFRTKYFAGKKGKLYEIERLI